MASIKERLDVASVPLFDCSVAEVDDKCRQLLTQLSSQLANLCTVLAAVTSGAGFITQLGMEELECRQNVTGLVLLYTQAIHWFVSVGLLPEQVDSQASLFPVKQLLAQYREKRRQLAALPVSYGQPGLLVDILCKDIGDELRSKFEREVLLLLCKSSISSWTWLPSCPPTPGPTWSTASSSRPPSPSSRASSSWTTRTGMRRWP